MALVKWGAGAARVRADGSRAGGRGSRVGGSGVSVREGDAVLPEFAPAGAGPVEVGRRCVRVMPCCPSSRQRVAGRWKEPRRWKWGAGA